MIIYLFFLNWILSSMFIFMNHPLSLGCILLLQTILISVSSGFLYYNFWFSYILFLIMVGGMLVMFMYMTSIASNEKFKMSQNMLIFILAMMIILISMTVFTDNFYSNNMTMLMSSKCQSALISNLSLNKFFNKPNLPIMITLILYLLLSLIAVVKISMKKSGTLRKK